MKMHMRAASVVIAASLLAWNAHAQEKTLHIRAQELSEALNALARQANIQIVYEATATKGHRANAIDGVLDPRKALTQLLEGSGFTFEVTGPDNYVVKPVPEQIVKEAPTQLPQIEVRSAKEAVSAYYRPIASTATKTDTPLMQTPMTVEVLPKPLLQEMGVVNTGLADVVKYSGVTTQGGGIPAAEQLYFRGFQTSTTLWNGFRVEDFGTKSGINAGVAWMGNVSSVEMIKGPSSILYGRAEPGGAVNVLTNRPQETSRTAVTAGVGSWSDRWLGIDSTGALNEDKTLLYRINVSGEESDTWFNWNKKNRSHGIAPALEWRISPQTTLSYEGLYRTVEGYSTNATIPWDTATGQLATNDPKKTFMPDSLSTHKLNRTTLGLNHQFDEDWSISWKYMHDVARTPKANYVWAAAPVSFPASAGALTVTINNGWNVYDLTTDATMLDLTGHITALGVKHTILLGADYYKKRGSQRGGYDWSGTQTTNYFDPASPDWNIPQQYLTEQSNRDTSIYLQDQMALPGNWHLLLGGRYQRLVENSANSGVADPQYQKNAFLPRFGLLWQPLPWLSTYYSYSENLGSNQGAREFTGSLLKPEFSKQHELGVKGEWLDGRLSALFSVFDLTKTNVALADAAHPGFSIAAGEVRSKGYEFNLQGAVTNNWNVLVNYSHAKPVVVGDDVPAWGQSLTAGTTLPMVSTRTFGLWTSYRLPQEALQGWKIGGGYNWASAPAPYPVQTFPTSSYKTVAAFASYETKIEGHKASVQLNVDNLFNEKYQLMAYDPVSAGILNVTWGAPRQVRLSLKTEF